MHWQTSCRFLAGVAFEVYDIAGNTLVGVASLGAVGLDRQLGGFAADPPTGPMGSSDDQPGSNAQLVQAMAGFGGSGAAVPNTVPAAGTISASLIARGRARRCANRSRIARRVFSGRRKSRQHPTKGNCGHRRAALAHEDISSGFFRAGDGICPPG